MIISNIWKNKIHIPSHQPEYHLPKNANGNRETTHLFESEKVAQIIVPYTRLDYQTWLLLLKHRAPRTPLINLYSLDWNNNFAVYQYTDTHILLAE